MNNTKQQLIAELLKFADALEEHELYNESQQVDVVVSSLTGTMKKEAGNFLGQAFDFIKKFFRSKDPRIQARLRQVIQENNKPLAKQEPTIKEILDKQWGFDNPTSRAGKDYTGSVYNPKDETK